MSLCQLTRLPLERHQQPDGHDRGDARTSELLEWVDRLEVDDKHIDVSPTLIEDLAGRLVALAEKAGDVGLQKALHELHGALVRNQRRPDAYHGVFERLRILIDRTEIPI